MKIVFKRTPENEDEWIIHALNIHGTFFERWCEATVRAAPGWEVVRTREAIQFPVSTDTLSRGTESAIDIEAVLPYDQFRGRFLRVLLECKKNNPDFVKWIFFLKSAGGGAQHRGPDAMRLHAREIGFRAADPSLHPSFAISPLEILTDTPLTDDAREVRGSYADHKALNSKTKTSNNAVTEACAQVSLATLAAFDERRTEMKSLIATNQPQDIPNRQLFVPVVVTTARLFVCLFNPTDVDGEVGEIEFDKVTGIEERKYLRFDYALPKRLQVDPPLAGTERLQGSPITRMDIIIVHSANLTELLQEFAKYADADSLMSGSRFR